MEPFNGWPGVGPRSARRCCARCEAGDHCRARLQYRKGETPATGASMTICFGCRRAAVHPLSRTPWKGAHDELAELRRDARSQE